jgi:phosphoribosyl 1,2-cyclic phosphodiesterase
VRLTFCGVRGSTPAVGAEFLRYGGHTSCLAISSGDTPPTLLIDGGTGIREVTDLLKGAAYDGSVLLGHLHWDHTQGLPFFAGGTAPGARLDLYLPAQGVPALELLARAVGPPHFPVTPDILGAGWTFNNLIEGHHLIEGLDVLAREIPHKGGRAFGYRVTDGYASIAYLSDHSPTSLGPGPDLLGELHEAALELADGVELLIHDAQHRADEFPAVGYLGHSSPDYGVALAAAAGAKTLVLFHHSPTRTDAELDQILVQTQLLAQREAPGLTVIAAAQGLVIDTP